MAFDGLGGIKSISVPTWLKLLIFAIGIVVLVGDMIIIWLAVINPGHKDMFAASVQLLGSLVPLLLVILLLTFSTRGPESIARRTSNVLLRVVPDTISRSLTWNPTFEAIETAQWKSSRRNDIRIEVAHHPGDFSCIYRIVFPDNRANPAVKRVVILVIELKVRQANIHLCIPRDAFEKYCGQTGVAGFDAFKKAFPSTLSGAEKAGCKINAGVYQLPLAQNAAQTAVVVYRELSPDFFTDPSEQLFVIQDAITMLKGFAEEALDESQPVTWFPAVNT